MSTQDPVNMTRGLNAAFIILGALIYHTASKFDNLVPSTDVSSLRSFDLDQATTAGTATSNNNHKDDHTQADQTATGSILAEESVTYSFDLDYGTAAGNNNFEDDVFDGVKARPFDVRAAPFPCSALDAKWNESRHDTPTNSGFMFVKPAKVASSTTAGVALRIVKNVAKRTHHHDPMCGISYQHGTAALKFPQRHSRRALDDSYLWSVLRDPTKRATSAFFHFKVSRQKVEPNDDNFMDYILNNRIEVSRDYYLTTLKTGAEYKPNTDNPVDVANKILEDYDFIGVTERMDESLVVLKMLLNLTMADILYVSTKTSGGFDDGQNPAARNTCTYITKSFISRSMNKFFHSDEWRERVKYDVALHRAANRSLDMTIDDRIGREKFEQQLELFHKAQNEVSMRCTNNVVLPCTAGGEFKHPNETDCMLWDLGCGMDCLDHVATELELW